MSLTTIIYSSYKDLPEYKVALQRFENVKETYELAVSTIKADLEKAEKRFIKERDERRAQAKWEYTLTSNINDHGKHFHITRKALNPLEGDTQFYEDRKFQSFKVVNAVIIADGSGYVLPVNSGYILSADDLFRLDEGVVPDVLKSK